MADGVATVTLDHPPQPVDRVLLPSLRGFIHRVKADADVRVIVFQSGDPEFFSAHGFFSVHCFFSDHGDMAYITDPEACPLPRPPRSSRLRGPSSLRA